MEARRNARQLEISLALVWSATLVSLSVIESARNEVVLLAGLLGMGSWTLWVLQGSLAFLASSAFTGITSLPMLVSHISIVLAVSGLAALADPTLLVHPFGHMILNVFLVFITYLAYRLRTSGWSEELLRFALIGLALLWAFQGLVPKVLFQHPIDLALMTAFSGDRVEASKLLMGLGVLEIFLAVLTLVLRRQQLRRLLAAEAVALFGLGIFSGVLEPSLWVSTFVSVPKTLVVGFAALILAQQLRVGEEEFRGAKSLLSG